MGTSVASPPERVQQGTRDAQRVGVVLGNVFGKPGHACVQLGAARLLVGRFFAGRGLQQRRPRQKGLRAPAHHHHVVGEPGHIGPPAVDDPCTTEITGSPAADSRARPAKIAPPRTKCSTRYLSRLAPADSTRCTNGSLFSSAIFVHAGTCRVRRPASRPRRCQRRRHQHHSGAADIADADHRSAAANAALRIGHVLQITRQRRQLEQRRAGIEQPGDTFARQLLPAPLEQRRGLRALVARALFERAQLRDQTEHVLAVGGERGRLRVDAGQEGRH